VAVSNTYYLARMLRSEKPDDRKLMDRISIVWPNQKSFGTHINISGGGMVKTSKNQESAVKFLEYLASDDAQRYFADGNNEWPVVAGVKTSNPALDALGKFKAETIPVAVTGANQTKVQQMLDRVGYK